MLWFWIGLATLVSVPVVVSVGLIGLHFWLRYRYLHVIERIFLERPFFVIPRGQPVPDAEDVRIRTRDGLTLAGCYLKGQGPRRGVILFGLEFGSNRWACVSYCDRLLTSGYDSAVRLWEVRGSTHGSLRSIQTRRQAARRRWP